MKAKLFDERGEVTFDPEDVKEISIEVGENSILILLANGECYRAVSISKN